MNIKDKIIEISNTLDELDNYNDTLQDSLANVELRIIDLLHYIEYNKLKTNQCYRVIKKIHELRLERRKIKNDIELMKVFKTNQNKLLQIDNRKILLSFVGKTDKSLKTSIYKNRVYTEEEINEIIGGDII